MTTDPQLIDSQLTKEGYIFLGWANGWGDRPEILKQCTHRMANVQHDRRGTENTLFCTTCKIYFKYDSSD